MTQANDLNEIGIYLFIAPRTSWRLIPYRRKRARSAAQTYWRLFHRWHRCDPLVSRRLPGGCQPTCPLWRLIADLLSIWSPRVSICCQKIAWSRFLHWSPHQSGGDPGSPLLSNNCFSVTKNLLNTSTQDHSPTESYSALTEVNLNYHCNYLPFSA